MVLQPLAVLQTPNSQLNGFLLRQQVIAFGLLDLEALEERHSGLHDLLAHLREGVEADFGLNCAICLPEETFHGGPVWN